MNQVDVAIVGAGTGGIACAIWGHRFALDTLLLDRGQRLGGQLHQVHCPIPDYPGLWCRNGQELIEKLEDHLARLEIVPQKGVDVQGVSEDGTHLLVEGKPLHAKAIVIATGVRKRKLDIPGFDRLLGSGVECSFNAKRDVFEGRNVCIIGGGDGAFENALMLAETCPSVTIVCRRDEFRAMGHFVEQANKHPRIEFVLRSHVSEIKGNGWVEAVTIQGPEGEVTRPFDAVLVKIGVDPCVSWLGGLCEQDEQGYLKADDEQRTSHPNIWAVGDVCSPRDPSISLSVGQACVAMRSIQRQLRKH